MGPPTFFEFTVALPLTRALMAERTVGSEAPLFHALFQLSVEKALQVLCPRMRAAFGPLGQHPKKPRFIGVAIAASCGGGLFPWPADDRRGDAWERARRLLPFPPHQTLDDSAAPNLGCRVVENGRRKALSSLFLVFARQRSFNWQSTAFVMRGLWVRLPSLALGLPGRLR